MEGRKNWDSRSPSLAVRRVAGPIRPSARPSRPKARTCRFLVVSQWPVVGATASPVLGVHVAIDLDPAAQSGSTCAERMTRVLGAPPQSQSDMSVRIRLLLPSTPGCGRSGAGRTDAEP